MVHRIYKAAALSTNRQNLQRDIMTREAMFQGLRFIAKGVGLVPVRQLSDERDGMPPEVTVGGSLKELINTGLFEDIYFEPTQRQLDLERSDIQVDDGETSTRLSDIFLNCFSLLSNYLLSIPSSYGISSYR